MSLGTERPEGYALRDELRAAPLPGRRAVPDRRPRTRDAERRAGSPAARRPDRRRRPRPTPGRPFRICEPGKWIATSRSGWTIAAAR